MASKKVLLTFVAVTLAASVSAELAVEDMFFLHPVMFRMRELDNALDVTQINGPDENAAATFIRRELELNSPTQTAISNRGESMIAMLKMLATLRDRYSIDFSMETGYPHFTLDELCRSYSKVMKELVKLSLDPAAEIIRNRAFAEYALDWFDFVGLLDLLGDYQPRHDEIEWASYVCLLVLENTSHLKHSFSKGMMLQLNILRSKANAISLVEAISAENRTEHTTRFPFKEIMIDSELSNRNESQFESQMKQILVKKSANYAIAVRMRFRMMEMQHRSVAVLYSALLELSDNELVNYVDEIAYGIQLVSLSLENPIIARLHTMLVERCLPLTEADNGLAERLADFNYIWDEYIRNNDYFRDGDVITPKYLDYSTIIYKMINKGTMKDLADKIQLIFFNAESVILNSAVFDDQQELEKFDKNHIALYEADSFTFRYPPQFLEFLFVNESLISHTLQAEEVLRSIPTNSSADLFNIRNKNRIVLRLAVHMANLRKRMFRDITQVESIIEDLAHIYIELMKLGADVFASDSMLMDEWYYLTLNYPKQISKILNQEMIYDLAQYTRAQSADADAVLYVFLARLANALGLQKRQSDAEALIQNVLRLEEKVGYADTSSPFIQKHVLRDKQLFYIYYPHAAYQTDLTELIDHHVELITSLTSWYDQELRIGLKYTVKSLAKQQLLDGIFTAVTRDSDAEALLNDASDVLRSKVHKLASGFNHEYGFAMSVRYGYEDLGSKAERCEHIFGKMT